MAERFNALVLKTSTPKESRVQISTDPKYPINIRRMNASVRYTGTQEHTGILNKG